MKILMCCAGGLSSSIVKKKMKQYGETVGEEIVVNAVGTNEIEAELAQGGYQVLLYAPQVRNRANEIKGYAEKAGIPCDAMAPQDYAISNCEHIYKQVKKLIG